LRKVSPILALILVSASAVFVLRDLISGVVTARAQAPSTEPTLVHVYASDFEFIVDHTIIPSGPVHFEMSNLSPTYKHEVWIYPIDERDAASFHEMLHLKRTGQRVEERAFITDVLASSGEVDAGAMMAFDAVLPPGFYELACLAREGEGDERMLHYDQGMYTVIAVR